MNTTTTTATDPARDARIARLAESTIEAHARAILSGIRSKGYGKHLTLHGSLLNSAELAEELARSHRESEREHREAGDHFGAEANEINALAYDLAAKHFRVSATSVPL